ncbi:MBL fold metallo-hydrolase [Aliidiomarina halalkaliphila]|uniref:MBL fold metallo-hydrolase n=1 Tax=Aliidiomarina halalkaliphila TaxID=2593535 RepID=A0A552X5H3_9GAMM|nr:MBL fold metallo-hydrolase [Aliidiomarina halalkaliphila]TRW50209.1 MBL fold metallo-hydrolase [Aliidiomarina halalkaliphila]
MDVQIIHHGARTGVTGSCHELWFNPQQSVLVDIGLFQGAETSPGSATQDNQAIDFPIEHVEALVVTHCHIDHVGRLPWLLIAGFRKPIYCTRATAHLLPLVIEDALKVGMTRNGALIAQVTALIRELLVPVDYQEWVSVHDDLQIRFHQAGHILGSAFVECEVGPSGKRVVFSGDIGCKNSPLLPDPCPLPVGTDYLVLESTYGDRNHENRVERASRLKAIVEHCVSDRGAILIPAFSIGRTQELLYELEDIIFQERNNPDSPHRGVWEKMVVIVDSPMAAEFTKQYRAMKDLWDCEATQRLEEQRHPLNFSRLHTVNSHDEHVRIVNYLRSTADPCIVIAASGMCTGGRMVNYLRALLPDPRTDVVFVGFQAEGTPGRDIQRWGPRGGYVDLEGERIYIRAEIHTLGGYSAHADQQELMEFVGDLASGTAYVSEVRLVHGDAHVQRQFRDVLRERFPALEVSCATDT